MRAVTGFIILSFAILTFSFGVNAQSFTRGESNGPIEQQVRKRILGLPRYEVFDNIGFTVNDGVVTLTGKVRNAVNRKSAERVVEDIPGVTHVVNNIEVLPLGSFDESIRRGLYRQLASAPGLGRYFSSVNPSVRLIVERGRVSLEGFVANKTDFDTMNILAHGVPGVFNVDNNLVIDSNKAR